MRRRLRAEPPEPVKTVKRLETLTLKSLVRAVLACVRLGQQHVRGHSRVCVAAPDVPDGGPGLPSG